MSQQFSAELLPDDVEAGDTLYVTDRVLNIVYVNDEWASFARQNKGTDLLTDGWNSSVLENLSGAQRQRWQEIYRLLCEGRMPHHKEVMNCSSPSERRIYQLRVSPIKDEAGDVAWLVHHNVRTDSVEKVVGRLGSALGRLDGQQALSDEFRVRIVERRIRIPRFNFVRYFEPLDEIGGDLIWHREYPGGVSDLIHADVMGHGTEAGLVAAKLAVVLDEMGSAELSPSATVAGLNRAMLRIVPDDEVVFATGLCIRFDRRSDHVVFCNFGGERPIFSQSGQVRLLGGFPVGLAERTERWVATPLTLSEHGSRFLVFSDGITEQFNADGSMFGADGLQRAFEERLAVPLDQMVDMIVEALEQFRGGALVKDDQTLLALDFIGDA